ncbi:MAG: hypothetical protein WA459_07460 [Stellaceae bacterium]
MQKRYAWLTCLIVDCATQHGSLPNNPVFGSVWEPAQMMLPLSPQKRLSLREKFKQIDRVAGDLNVLLVVVAIGLAVLDMTFVVTLSVIDNLPPITRIGADQAPPEAK